MGKDPAISRTLELARANPNVGRMMGRASVYSDAVRRKPIPDGDVAGRPGGWGKYVYGTGNSVVRRTGKTIVIVMLRLHRLVEIDTQFTHPMSGPNTF